jgi:O-antigen/teichoic acid export membrane protein
MQTICIVLENITVNSYINKQYPYIKSICKGDKLNKKELKEIVVNVRALILHKIGSYVFASTDNLIISKFIGIVQVGYYSNYVLIVNMINSFITTLTNNVVSSLGNLIATNEENKKYKVFKEMNLICFILYGVSAVCFINLFTPFIAFCFGEKFVLDNLILYLISFNNFVFGMTSVSIVFQNASGLYDKDKFMPLLQSVVNLIISIVLAIKIGLAGVLIGTLISNLIPLIVKPSIVYKNIFNDNVLKYFLTLFKQTFLIVFITIISGTIIQFVKFDNYLIQFIINLVITLAVAGATIITVYLKNDSFKSLIERAKNILHKRGGSVV